MNSIQTFTEWVKLQIPSISSTPGVKDETVKSFITSLHIGF